MVNANAPTRGAHDLDGGGMSAPVVVVKLGGRVLEAAHVVPELARSLATLGAPAVLVHGGGAEVSAWCARLGIEPRFVDGLRVTDAATLEVAAAVLAGLANKRLVAALREGGVDAVGLSALDGGTATLAPHPDAAGLGAVGAVTAIEPALVRTLLAAGRTPVLASLGAHGGALLNLNADALAAALAVALDARALLLLSDTPGVRLHGVYAAALDRSGLAAALDHPEVSGGMRPKLGAARTALEGGVGQVFIGCWTGAGTLEDVLAGRGDGTRIAATRAGVSASTAAGAAS